MQLYNTAMFNQLNSSGLTPAMILGLLPTMVIFALIFLGELWKIWLAVVIVVTLLMGSWQKKNWPQYFSVQYF